MKKNNNVVVSEGALFKRRMDNKLISVGFVESQIIELFCHEMDNYDLNKGLVYDYHFSISLNYLLMLEEYTLIEEFITKAVEFEIFNTEWKKRVINKLDNREQQRDKKSKKVKSKKHVKPKNR